MKLRKTKFARILVFVKFAVWDVFLNGRNMTLKECWGVAGINTVMTPIPPR